MSAHSPGWHCFCLARGCGPHFSSPAACAQLTTYTDPLFLESRRLLGATAGNGLPTDVPLICFRVTGPCAPKEAASQAGGPKIAVYVCPWMGLSITARPLPPDASFWWLALIGPLGVGQGSWFCPLGLWPLKGPIVTTWKGESALILGQPESPSYREAERFVEVLPCRLCVARNDGLFHNSLVCLFF